MWNSNLETEKFTVFDGLLNSFAKGYETDSRHTTYSRNNMRQKCEGNCGLWVLNEII